MSQIWLGKRVDIGISICFIYNSVSNKWEQYENGVRIKDYFVQIDYKDDILNLDDSTTKILRVDSKFVSYGGDKFGVGGWIN